jgi:hypothetical protein
MTTRSRWLLVVILGAVGLAEGLSLALGHSSKYGPEHSCPARASRSACTYPPDLRFQRTEWSAAGLVLGLTLAAAVIFAVSRSTESGRVSAGSAHRHKWPRPALPLTRSLFGTSNGSAIAVTGAAGGDSDRRDEAMVGVGVCCGPRGRLLVGARPGQRNECGELFGARGDRVAHGRGKHRLADTLRSGERQS